MTNESIKIDRNGVKISIPKSIANNQKHRQAFVEGYSIVLDYTRKSSQKILQPYLDMRATYSNDPSTQRCFDEGYAVAKRNLGLEERSDEYLGQLSKVEQELDLYSRDKMMRNNPRRIPDWAWVGASGSDDDDEDESILDWGQ